MYWEMTAMYWGRGAYKKSEPDLYHAMYLVMQQPERQKHLQIGYEKTRFIPLRHTENGISADVFLTHRNDYPLSCRRLSGIYERLRKAPICGKIPPPHNLAGYCRKDALRPACLPGTESHYFTVCHAPSIILPYCQVLFWKTGIDGIRPEQRKNWQCRYSFSKRFLHESKYIIAQQARPFSLAAYGILSISTNISLISLLKWN